MSHATVRWHERDLLENHYIEFDTSYAFPRGLIDPEDAGLFALLTSPGRSRLLRACYSDPGISLLDLAASVKLSRQSASKIASELGDVGLVTLVEDGRFRRHYPTDLLALKRVANRPRAKAFAEAFVRRLKDEGLSPEPLRSEESVIVVRFGSTAKRVVLDVPLDPYVTAWNSEH